MAPRRSSFTEPQITAAGVALQDALDEGLNAGAYNVPDLGHRRVPGREVPGTNRIAVDEDRGVMIGATFVGADVAELAAGGQHRDRRRDIR